MANLMDLVRELKVLTERKKAGETLPAGDEKRRKELKEFLRSSLEAPGSSISREGLAVSGEGDPVIDKPPPRPTPVTSPPPRAPAASSAPKPPPLPPPQPVVPAVPTTAPPVRAAPRPVAAPSPIASFMEEMLPPVPQRAAPQPAAPAPIQTAPRPMATAPAPAPVPSAYVPKKDAYAIADVSSLINDAMSSEAVAKVDPNRKAQASPAQIEEAEARAEAALRANKTPERPKNPDQAAQQLQSAGGGYTPPDNDFVNEQYYGSFESEGYAVVSAADAGDLKPIDPREIEIQKLDVAAGPSGATTTAAVPAGLAFLDDFPALYAKRVLPAPDDEVDIDSDDPNLLVPGKRKVTVHLLNGEKKQGSIRTLRRGELGFKLEPLGSGQTEELSISQVKAVFIHTQANAAPKETPGRPLTATFRDGRAVQGVSDDYQPGAPIFTLVPPSSGRGQFERIIVNGAAVQSVR
jgi:hypothetical protein